MLQNFGTALSREQMKNVKGGYEGTCQALIEPGMAGNPPVVVTGLSMGEASGANGMIHWCCDSCSTASWAVPQP